jgi:DsbC/DsbD-like thiol-disulfide interchange protein
MPTMRSILTLIWALGLALNLGAATARDAAQTKVDLLLGQETARPGSVVSVGLRLTTEPGWHTYWRNPGESGSPTTVEWTLPEGVVGTPLEGPAPEKIMIGGILTLAYHDEVVLLTTVALPSGLAAGKHSLRGKVQWLECSDKLCVPRSQTVSAEIVIGTDTKEGRDFTALKEAQAKLPKPSEALEASASWDGAGTQTERPVTLHWSVPPGVTHVDFFPYESKALSVRLTNEWSEIKEGRASVRRVVDRLEGEWPETLSGLVVFGQADVASHRFSEVSFKLSTPAVPIADAGGVAAVTVVSPPSAPAASISVLLRMLVFAFLGGAILNIMPCVLPVISLKILGFVNQSRTSPGRVRQLGLFYALGVLVSFLILAGMVIGLKQAGKAASWGIQFGNPQFLVVLTTLILLVSLNLFGVFEITLGGVAGSADQLARKEGGGGRLLQWRFGGRARDALHGTISGRVHRIRHRSTPGDHCVVLCHGSARARLSLCPALLELRLVESPAPTGCLDGTVQGRDGFSHAWSRHVALLADWKALRGSKFVVRVFPHRGGLGGLGVRTVHSTQSGPIHSSMDRAIDVVGCGLWMGFGERGGLAFVQQGGRFGDCHLRVGPWSH